MSARVRQAANRKFMVGVLLLGVLIGAVAVLAWVAGSKRSPEQRQQAARDLLAGVHVSVTVAASTLAATNAVANFGGKGGLRLVRVRIVDQLHSGCASRPSRTSRWQALPGSVSSVRTRPPTMRA